MGEQRVRMLIATISPCIQVKKRIQNSVMILDSLGVQYDTVDVCDPSKQNVRAMMECSDEKRLKPGLYPQFFLDDVYLGDYLDFENAVEDNSVADFLKMPSLAQAKSVQGNSVSHISNDAVASGQDEGCQDVSERSDEASESHLRSQEELNEEEEKESEHGSDAAENEDTRDGEIKMPLVDSGQMEEDGEDVEKVSSKEESEHDEKESVISEEEAEEDKEVHSSEEDVASVSISEEEEGSEGASSASK